MEKDSLDHVVRHPLKNLSCRRSSVGNSPTLLSRIASTTLSKVKPMLEMHEREVSHVRHTIVWASSGLSGFLPTVQNNPVQAGALDANLPLWREAACELWPVLHWCKTHAEFLQPVLKGSENHHHNQDTALTDDSFLLTCQSF